uniref:Uncharacterized protein n=1 Tax=Opuntia streptacantha TaxID=393608 RepID=A0A7C8YD07_OPUST
MIIECLSYPIRSFRMVFYNDLLSSDNLSIIINKYMVYKVDCNSLVFPNHTCTFKDRPAPAGSRHAPRRDEIRPSIVVMTGAIVATPSNVAVSPVTVPPTTSASPLLQFCYCHFRLEDVTVVPFCGPEEAPECLTARAG